MQKKKEFLGLKGNKGQFAIESVLLMSVLVGFFIFATNVAREKKLISKLVKEPMRNVAAMTAFGTWKADGCIAPGKSKQTIGKCHPNSISRSLSSNPNSQ